MPGDLFEDVAGSPRWFPVPGLGCEARVEYNPRQVEQACLGLRGHCVLTESLAAPLA